MSAPAMLLIVPPSWAPFWLKPLLEAAPSLRILVHERDSYEANAIDYAMCFRPQPGLLKTLPKLKVVFSLGAGVDGILTDKDYPKHVPLVRLVDHSLSRDMTHYIVLHTLLHHRQQRLFDAQQGERAWRQMLPWRRTEETRVGILGLGEIGTMAAERLRDLDFPVAGWSRTRKSVAGIESFAGADELAPFLARSDILACVLPLTPETRSILNRHTFAQLPQHAFVINVARGGHVVEPDLIAAIDSGHLGGAALDVFQEEPLPQSSPLWSHPKICVTPHIAAVSEPRATTRSALEGIRQFESGEKLSNLVDLARGY